MGRKIRAAQASLVAAFLAAGGSAAAKGASTAANAPQPHMATIDWGDQLIRFIKLDGFPDYMKSTDSAALTNYYKEQIIGDAATLYDKWLPAVQDVLALYQKADAGPLDGILIGLEQYNKANDPSLLVNYLKIKGNLDNYVKFQKWFGDLADVARSDGEQGSALDYYIKLTGISSVPSPEQLNGGPTDGGPS